MQVTVVDASALAAVAFAEDEAPAVLERLHGATLAGPPLIRFELANVCLSKIRRQPEDGPRLLRALKDTLDMPMGIHEVDHLAVVELARETGLSAYDASYLWLARHLDAELVTLDEELAAAAQQS